MLSATWPSSTYYKLLNVVILSKSEASQEYTAYQHFLTCTCIAEYYGMHMWVLRHKHTSTTSWITVYYVMNMRVLRHEYASTKSWICEYYAINMRVLRHEYASTLSSNMTIITSWISKRSTTFEPFNPQVSLNSRSILAQVFPPELWDSVARPRHIRRSDGGQLATDKRTGHVQETAYANEGGARRWPYYRKVITGRLYSVLAPDGNHRPMSLWKRTEL